MFLNLTYEEKNNFYHSIYYKNVGLDVEQSLHSFIIIATSDDFLLLGFWNIYNYSLYVSLKCIE